MKAPRFCFLSFVPCALLLSLSLTGITRAQVTSIASGNWADTTTWSDNMVPAAANTYEIINGDVVTADNNLNFPDATTLTVTNGSLSLDFSVGTPIDSANTTVLNGGTLTTAINDPGVTDNGFNPGTNNIAHGLHVTANSSLVNALNGVDGTTVRNIDINGGGLQVDPGNTGAVTLSVNLNPSGVDNANRDRRVSINNGAYLGGVDDAITVTGNEANDHFRIENGVDTAVADTFKGTVTMSGGARYVINKNGYLFNETAIVLSAGTNNANRSEVLVNQDNIVLSSDIIDDSANPVRSHLADPAINVANGAQNFTVSTTINDYIGVSTQNATSSSAAEVNLTGGITVGGLTDLNATPLEQSGGSPRELINVAPGDDAASTVIVTNDARLDSVRITFEAIGNLSSDVLDGGDAGTLTLGLTGNQTPLDLLSLSTQIAIELDYNPAFGDMWTVFDSWVTIDNQFSEVITAPGSAFSLDAGQSYLFTIENGGTEGKVTVVPEPSRLVLVLLGVFSVALHRRRRP